MKKTKIFKIHFICFFIGIFFILAGCEVFNLEEQPKSFTSPENFFNSSQQIESVLAACQSRCFQVWRMAYDDGHYIFVHTDQLAGGDLIIPTNHASDFYALHFANIKDLNFAIASMKKRTLEGLSATESNQLMGQLKFLRAWNYFQVVRMWGPVPLLTDETPDYFNALPSRAPIADVYQLIVTDFQEAINKLPVTWGNLVGRPTKDAAKALLAKAYLTMATAPLNETSNYAKAAELAKQVIDAGNYHLVHDIDQVFSMATKYGPEMIWSFNANKDNPATNPKIWSGIYGWGDNSADIWWVDNVYPEQPRKYAYIEILNHEGVRFSNLPNKVPGIKKYLYDTWEDFQNKRSYINIPVIRYAEVLLIFAEAENMSKGGPTQEVVDAINSVIDRANGYEPNPNYSLLTTGMSKEAFDAAVIDERSFELCFEYDRWFDLVRKRILKEKSRPEIQNNFDEHIYLFPIPESEIKLNPNMEQNIGYN
ncbi:MAG: RagB/SusD family nutrient uptake outer membrane protein [Prolixibacteraceae bacterium]|jgi:hypothetical protein|nr:RagB/SusD family nutrient uptake outer membrane protein [Prolixibacteraceae bacterium]